MEPLNRPLLRIPPSRVLGPDDGVNDLPRFPCAAASPSKLPPLVLMRLIRSPREMTSPVVPIAPGWITVGTTTGSFPDVSTYSRPRSGVIELTKPVIGSVRRPVVCTILLIDPTAMIDPKMLGAVTAGTAPDSRVKSPSGPVLVTELVIACFDRI